MCRLDLVEGWPRFDDVAADLPTDWLTAVSLDAGPEPSAQDVIDELKTASA